MSVSSRKSDSCRIAWGDLFEAWGDDCHGSPSSTLEDTSSMSTSEAKRREQVLPLAQRMGEAYSTRPYTLPRNTKLRNNDKKRALCLSFPACQFGTGCHFYHPEDEEPKIQETPSAKRSRWEASSPTSPGRHSARSSMASTSHQTMGHSRWYTFSDKRARMPARLCDDSWAPTVPRPKVSAFTNSKSRRSESGDSRQFSESMPAVFNVWGDSSPAWTQSQPSSDGWGTPDPHITAPSLADAWGSPDPPVASAIPSAQNDWGSPAHYASSASTANHAWGNPESPSQADITRARDLWGSGNHRHTSLRVSRASWGGDSAGRASTTPSCGAWANPDPAYESSSLGPKVSSASRPLPAPARGGLEPAVPPSLESAAAWDCMNGSHATSKTPEAASGAWGGSNPAYTVVSTASLPARGEGRQAYRPPVSSAKADAFLAAVPSPTPETAWQWEGLSPPYHTQSLPTTASGKANAVCADQVSGENTALQTSSPSSTLITKRASHKRASSTGASGSRSHRSARKFARKPETSIDSEQPKSIPDRSPIDAAFLNDISAWTRSFASKQIPATKEGPSCIDKPLITEADWGSVTRDWAKDTPLLRIRDPAVSTSPHPISFSVSAQASQLDTFPSGGLSIKGAALRKKSTSAVTMTQHIASVATGDQPQIRGASTKLSTLPHRLPAANALMSRSNIRDAVTTTETAREPLSGTMSEIQIKDTLGSSAVHQHSVQTTKPDVPTVSSTKTHLSLSVTTIQTNTKYRYMTAEELVERFDRQFPDWLH